MENNKTEKTLDELKKELEEARNAYIKIQDCVNQKEEKEKERKRAQLALEKENRKKVIEEKYEELTALIGEYIKDYGSCKFNFNKDYGFTNLYRMFF